MVSIATLLGPVVMEGTDSEPFTARRAESLDASGVKKLIKRHTESVFGRVNVDNVM